MLNRPIVSILFAAAFLEEVARYASDRSHLFPFNLLSTTEHLFEMATVPPVSLTSLVCACAFCCHTGQRICFRCGASLY